MSATVDPSSSIPITEPSTDPPGLITTTRSMQAYLPLSMRANRKSSEPPSVEHQETILGSSMGASSASIVDVIEQIPQDLEISSSETPETSLQRMAYGTASAAVASSETASSSGTIRRRRGPITPPLHQLILANGSLGSASLLSSPATTILSSSSSSGSSSLGPSPRSSASLESLVDDLASSTLSMAEQQQQKSKVLINKLIEENEDLFTENHRIKANLTAKEKAILIAKEELSKSQAIMEDLQKKLKRREEKYFATKQKLDVTRKQCESAEFVGGIFSTSFKQQRALAETRSKENEALTVKTEQLESLLGIAKQEQEALALQRESLAAEHARALEELRSSQASELEGAHSQAETLRQEVKALERKNAKMMDKHAFLALQIDELENRLEERGSQLEGLEARNEELCETIRLMQDREEELEGIIEETQAQYEEMHNMLQDLELAYAELKEERDAGNGRRRHHRDRSEQASVTSEDMDLEGLEEAANAVDEHGEHIEQSHYSKRSSRHRPHTPSDAPLPEIDVNDPVAVAAQIQRLERLTEDYHDYMASMHSERRKLNERALEIEAMEDKLRVRLDQYKEIELDFRERENDFYAHCDVREREFLDLSDEYEKWRMDCEVREVSVEEERIEVWRFRRELERRLERIVKREAHLRRREGEVRWRMLCLDGALGDAEGCWRCVPAPEELFPPTPPLDFTHIEDEVEAFAEEQRVLREEALRVAAETGEPPVQPPCALVPIHGVNVEEARELMSELVADDADERYLKDELDDAPFEFDGREAVKKFLKEQDQYERDRRMDEFIDFQAEEPELQKAAEEFDEVVNKRVEELMRKADEKRRLAKEQKERREMQESREGEVAGVYDDNLVRITFFIVKRRLDIYMDSFRLD
ncbi:hypothetical protein FRC20_006693 [Serendipita sp. 405]|nr:hypothetical protein FRC20_006693 [Serendipita sp. 405]